MNKLITWDHQLTAHLQHHPQSWRSFFKFITNFGSSKFIIPMAIIIACVAWQQGEHLTAFAFLGGCALLLVPTLVKYGVRRTRPFHTHEALYKNYTTPSFPSGHAFNSALFYSMLAQTAAAHMHNPFGASAVVAATLAIIVIGYSRIYLGAHFIFDVLVGWLLGVATAVVLITQIILV